jgi:MFS family permease
VEAGFYFTIPYIVAAVCSPLCGLFVEKYGKRMTITIWGSALLVIAHIYQVSIPDCDKCYVPMGPLVLQGMSYTAYAVVLWGALPYMVEARVLGTAFGICTTF